MDFLLNPNARDAWTPLKWRNEDAHPTLFFRPLNGIRFLDLQPLVDVDAEGTILFTGRSCGAIVAAAFVDWDIPGGPPFPGAAEAVQQLDAVTLKQAAVHILASTSLGTVVRKNSVSASDTSPAPSNTPSAEVPHA